MTLTLFIAFFLRQGLVLVQILGFVVCCSSMFSIRLICPLKATLLKLSLTQRTPPTSPPPLIKEASRGTQKKAGGFRLQW